MRFRPLHLTLPIALLLNTSAPARQNPQTPPQRITKEDRTVARDMLANIASDLKKHYYDPQFHGLDWDSVLRSAENGIDNSSSLNHAFSEIAAALDKLNDSHTTFYPPPRPYEHDFGWHLQMIGDRCFVVRVRPKTDAEAKGIKAGDEILALNGFPPSRESLRKLQYVFDVLRPRPSLHVELRAPGAAKRELELLAQMRERKRIVNLTRGISSDVWDREHERDRYEHFERARLLEVGHDVLILKFPGFLYSEEEVSGLLKKARNRKALIIDLRANPGGMVDTLKAFLGGVIANDVRIGDRVTRNDVKSIEAKSLGHNAFSGKLIVLVDSGSASASEVFARVIQLQKRGTILGDATAGAVMESRGYWHKMGVETVVVYGASITDADIVMTDGKSLEHAGVLPDEMILPAASDLAAGRDPVLARAIQLCGENMTPLEAGALFPYEWPPQ